MPQGPLLTKDTSSASSSGSYYNLAAVTAGAQIKTGVGTLLGINVNVAGTGGANVITLYDGTSTSGTPLGVWPTTPISVIKINPINFTVGLFVVLTGTTLSGNITVVYL